MKWFVRLKGVSRERRDSYIHKKGDFLGWYGQCAYEVSKEHIENGIRCMSLKKVIVI